MRCIFFSSFFFHFLLSRRLSGCVFVPAVGCIRFEEISSSFARFHFVFRKTIKKTTTKKQFSHTGQHTQRTKANPSQIIIVMNFYTPLGMCLHLRRFEMEMISSKRKSFFCWRFVAAVSLCMCIAWNAAKC